MQIAKGEVQMTNKLEGFITKRRPTQVSVDLLGLKISWLEWCRSRGISPSAGLRSLIAEKMASAVGEIRNGSTISADGLKDSTPADVLFDVPERPTKRVKVALTESEFGLIEQIAAGEGMSVMRWVVGLIRGRLTQTPQFGQSELEALAHSQRQLLAIGRHLNQIVQMGHEGGTVTGLDLAQLEALEGIIREHTRHVSHLMTANIKRWKVQ